MKLHWFWNIRWPHYFLELCVSALETVFSVFQTVSSGPVGSQWADGSQTARWPIRAPEPRTKAASWLQQRPLLHDQCQLNVQLSKKPNAPNIVWTFIWACKCHHSVVDPHFWQRREMTQSRYLRYFLMSCQPLWKTVVWTEFFQALNCN